MNWISLSSTAIRRAAYDPDTRRMYIDFENSDPHYSFCGVPESIFQGLISASSAGHYYNNYIKDRYDCF